MISGCEFLNTSAEAREQFRYNVLQVLANQVYNQRGGGIAFYFGAANYSGVVRIEESLFSDCRADDSGGGVYMFLGGDDSAHDITVSGTNFTRNCALDGGGLEITHSNRDSIDNPNRITVENCRFRDNSANFGGGYKNIQLNDQTNANWVMVKDTVFENNEANVGAGIYLQAVVTVVKATLKRRVTMENW